MIVAPIFTDGETSYEVIVKYSGDIMGLESEMDARVEILSESYAIITLYSPRISQLLEYPAIEAIELPKTMVSVLQGALPASCISQVQSESSFGLSGEGVLVAIIDSGIDYTHPDFRNPDGTTRIVSIWDQTAEDGAPPKGFIGGREYSADELNEALSSSTPYSTVPQMDTLGHGTAVAGAAAGNGRASGGKNRGAAPSASIVAVRLGERGRPSFSRTTELMRAIKYVQDKARETNMPLAINISFGTNDGAHNGQSLFETYIDDMARKWKTVIVIAAGNEGVAGHHFSGVLQSFASKDIDFYVDGTTISAFYITMWKSFLDEISAELITPDGRTVMVLQSGDGTIARRQGGLEIIGYYGQPLYYTEAQEIYFSIRAIGGGIPQGLWTLRLVSRQVVDGKFNIWLPTTEEVTRQTGFARPEQDTTLTIPSTARNVITVGAYDHRMNAMADFSGRGYTLDGRVKPDIVAPGVSILTTRRGGGYDSFTGTSIAAPIVTGSAALMLQWGIVKGNDPFLYGERVKAFLKSGAARERDRAYPNNAWGFGRLCLKETMEILTSFTAERAVSAMGGNDLDVIDYESLSLEEFINMPDVVAFNTLYTPAARSYVDERPHIRLGALLANNNAILYTREKYMEEIFRDFGYDFSNVYPGIYGLLGREAVESAGIAAVHRQPFLDLRGRGVIIGFVDTGIDYTSPAFRYEDGTSKILYIWDQTGEGTLPPDVPLGAVYTQRDINRALTLPDPSEAVPHRDDVGHGTFLASVAAGRETGDFIGAAPDSEIIMVKLKPAGSFYRDMFLVPPEQDEAYESTDILLGIKYIVARALEQGKPCVICLGLGTNFGGHDGTNRVESYIDYLSNASGLVFCAGAGNETGAGSHTGGRLSRGETGQIDVRVGAAGSSFSVVIRGNVGDSMSISMRSPTGETVSRLAFDIGTVYRKKLVLEKSSIEIMFHQDRSRFIYIKVTDATPGTWQITLYGDSILSGEYNAWLPIRGLVSSLIEFVEPKPNYTTVIPSTADGAIACGAYESRDGSLYLRSSWGPTAGERVCPDLAAPGVSVEGYYPTGLGTMSGTSVSAAVTAGASALLFQWGIVQGNEASMNGNRIRTLLIRGCDRQEDMSYPNTRWGFGRLNLINSFSIIRDD